MRNHHSEGRSHLWIGALLGGLVVGASVLYLRSKKGKKVRDEIDDMYEGYKDRALSAVKEVKKSSTDWIKRIKKLMYIFRNSMESIQSSKNQNLKRGLVLGGLLTVIAAGAAIVLNHRSNAHDEGLVERIMKQADCWKERVATIVDAISGEEHESNGTHPNKSRIDDVIDLATTGIQFWQRIAKK